MKRVFVCAGLRIPKTLKHVEQAERLGQQLANANITLVQGGCADGLAGTILKSFCRYSDKVEIIMHNKYYDLEFDKIVKVVGRDKIKVKRVLSEWERLREVSKCDEVIILPGGMGTMEELLFLNEIRRDGESSLPITLVNIGGYYNNLLKQIQKSINEGFVSEDIFNFYIVNDVKEIEPYI